MPVIIPNGLPARDKLKEENIFTMKEGRAETQDIRPLEIAIVNLMPTKLATETQFLRMLSNSPLQVNITLVRMESHRAQNVSDDHLDNFYKTLDEIKKQRFDGMIITGAPVEFYKFEDVDYWNELTELLDYSKKNVYSRMFICWGAQAGLYYHHGIDKNVLDKKIFGVYEQSVVRKNSPLMRGFDDVFYAPHSRNTEVSRKEILKRSELRILAESDEVGPHIIATDNGREIYIMGHHEYDKETLAQEYFRDVEKGVDIDLRKGNSHEVERACQLAVWKLAELLRIPSYSLRYKRILRYAKICCSSNVYRPLSVENEQGFKADYRSCEKCERVFATALYEREFSIWKKSRLMKKSI